MFGRPAAMLCCAVSQHQLTDTRRVAEPCDRPWESCVDTLAPFKELFRVSPLLLLCFHLNFHSALIRRFLWLLRQAGAFQRSLQVPFSFNILTVTTHPPSSPFSLYFILSSSPLLLSPSFSLSTMVRSHGGRQLAGNRLAAMATEPSLSLRSP